MNDKYPGNINYTASNYILNNHDIIRRRPLKMEYPSLNENELRIMISTEFQDFSKIHWFFIEWSHEKPTQYDPQETDPNNLLKKMNEHIMDNFHCIFKCILEDDCLYSRRNKLKNKLLQIIESLSQAEMDIQNYYKANIPQIDSLISEYSILSDQSKIQDNQIYEGLQKDIKTALEIKVFLFEQKVRFFMSCLVEKINIGDKTLVVANALHQLNAEKEICNNLLNQSSPYPELLIKVTEIYSALMMILNLLPQALSNLIQTKNESFDTREDKSSSSSSSSSSDEENANETIEEEFKQNVDDLFIYGFKQNEILKVLQKNDNDKEKALEKLMENKHEKKEQKLERKILRNFHHEIDSLSNLGFNREDIIEATKSTNLSFDKTVDLLFQQKFASNKDSLDNSETKKEKEVNFTKMEEFKQLGFSEQLIKEAMVKFPGNDNEAKNYLYNLTNNGYYKSNFEASKQELLNMGFDEELCKYALSKCGSVSKSTRFIKSMISDNNKLNRQVEYNSIEIKRLLDKGISFYVAIKIAKDFKDCDEEILLKKAKDFEQADFSEQLKTLQCIGFDIDSSFEALEKHEGDVNLAINSLSKGLNKLKSVGPEKKEAYDPSELIIPSKFKNLFHKFSKNANKIVDIPFNNNTDESLCDEKIQPKFQESEEIKEEQKKEEEKEDFDDLTNILNFWPNEESVKKKIRLEYNSFNLSEDKQIVLSVLKQLQKHYSQEIPNILEKYSNNSKVNLLSLFHETNPFAERRALFLGRFILQKNIRDEEFECLLKEFQKKNTNGDLEKIKKIFFYFKTFQKCYSEICSSATCTIDNWNSFYLSSLRKNLTENFVFDEMLFGEVLALISRAVTLFKGSNYYPRETQILSVIIMSMSMEKGVLTQIDTGEGKSLVVAMLAVIRRLQGFNVDVVSSSSVLAERDAASFYGFFQLFGFKVISCHNDEDQKHAKLQKYKVIFTHDIIYGDVFEFQCALIEKLWFKEEINYNFIKRFIIVDEVDSMMIDDLGNMAQIACTTTGNDQINQILMMIWKKMVDLDNNLIEHDRNFYYQDPSSKKTFQVNDKQFFLRSSLSKLIDDIIHKNDLLPQYLIEYATKTQEAWINSAIQATLMEEDKDYLVNNKKRIIPINMATGVIQLKTSWSMGLHQFLEIKHALEISSVHNTHAFISNVCFFKNYTSHVNGMTGTLGSQSNIDTLKEIYNLETFIIPPFKEKQFIKLDDIICDSDEWNLQIIEAALQARKSKRAVLIINKSICEAKIIYDFLILKTGSNFGLYLYTRSDDSQQTHVTENTLNSGEIVVATNLAGRGTDFKLSTDVLNNGGLFVIVTFLPNNQRIELQALGRSGRNGQPGAGLLIMNCEDIEDIKVSKDVDQVKFIRNVNEKERNNSLKKNELVFVEKKDQLFKKFCNFSELNDYKRKKNCNVHLIEAIEDIWAKFIEEIDHKHHKSDSIDDFEKSYNTMIENVKNKIRIKENEDSIVQNPYFFIEKGNDLICSNKSKQALSYFKKAISLSKDAITANYNAAYCHLLKNSNDNGLDKAEDFLKQAIDQIQTTIIPRLASVQILFPEKERSSESDLNRQYKSLMNVYLTKLQFLESTIKNITSMKGKSFSVKLKNNVKKVFKNIKDEPGFLDLIQKGFFFVFNLEENPPKPSFWDCLFLGILACAQVVGGIILCCTGFSGFGIGMICEGIKDGCKLHRIVANGEEFSWKDWALEKAANYTSILLSPMDFTYYFETLSETTIEVTRTINPKFGEKMQKYYEVYKKYAPLAKMFTNLDPKVLKKDLIEKCVEKTLLITMEKVTKLIVTPEILKDLMKNILDFIKKKLKQVFHNIPHDIKTCVNKIWALSNCSVLKDKIKTLQDSINIENLEGNVKKNIKSIVEKSKTLFNKINGLTLVERFMSLINEIKNENGKESSVSEMLSIFSSIGGDSKIKTALCSKLDEIKYLDKFKVVSKKIGEFIKLGKEAKNLISGFQINDDIEQILSQVPKDREDVKKILKEIKSIQDLITSSQEDNYLDYLIDDLVETIANNCWEEISRNVLNVFANKTAEIATNSIKKFFKK